MKLCRRNHLAEPGPYCGGCGASLYWKCACGLLRLNMDKFCSGCGKERA